MAKIRVGVIGCGGISKSHFGAWQATGYGDVVACCDADEARARERAEAFGVPHVYTDWKELLKRDDIDAVDLCLPHHLHAPAAFDAARARKHVLVEKPIATTLGEAHEMVMACRTAGVKLMVEQSSYFSWTLHAARRLIDGGLIGDRTEITWHRMSSKDVITQAERNMAWKIGKETAGGGALHRDGIHEVYALRFAAGAEPTRVTAEGGTYVWPIELETTAHAIYRFANGCMATLVVSWSAQGAGDRGRVIYGTKGAVTLGGNRLQLHSEQAGLEEATLRGLVGEPAPLALSQADGVWTVEAPKVAGGITAAVDAFARAVAEDTELPVTGVDGLRALEMVIGAYRSAEEGRAISLPIVAL